MDKRGALDSVECDVETLTQQIQYLRTSLQSRTSPNTPRVHWVVQELLPTAAKGHLSNEARIAEDKRDWMVEIEASSGHPSETRSIPLRTWRDNRPPREDSLICPFREKYNQCLAVVARWAYERLILEVMQGNQALFIHRAEVERSWQWIDSIQDAWAKANEPPKPYPAGSWGPVASVALLARDEREWEE